MILAAAAAAAAAVPPNKGAEGGDALSEALKAAASDEPAASSRQTAAADITDAPAVEGGVGKRAPKGKPIVNEAQNADKPTFVLHRSTKVTKVQNGGQGCSSCRVCSVRW
jgi:hypothetical protein